jgi:hypothetical protein
LKRQNFKSWFACFFGLTIFAAAPFALAQAIPTASRAGTLQIGIAGTYVNPDYGEHYTAGPTLYGTLDFTQHIGVEGDIHMASILTPGDIGEDSYLFGPRYVFHHKRFSPYIKGLAGIGVINFQFDNIPHSSAKYIIYAVGGGLDIKATRHINVRAIDFEYQQWPTFSPHTLSPYAITVGVAYSFH